MTERTRTAAPGFESARERAERYHAQTWNMGEFQYVVGALGEVCRDLLAALAERDAAVARTQLLAEALRTICEIGETRDVKVALDALAAVGEAEEQK